MRNLLFQQVQEQFDLYKNNHDAPRLLQSVSILDFEIEVKFESTPGILNQLQGIIVQESDYKIFTFWILLN
jgi:hypothetical protein